MVTCPEGFSIHLCWFLDVCFLLGCFFIVWDLFFRVFLVTRQVDLPCGHKLLFSPIWMSNYCPKSRYTKRLEIQGLFWRIFPCPWQATRRPGSQGVLPLAHVGEELCFASLVSLCFVLRFEQFLHVLGSYLLCYPCHRVCLDIMRSWTLISPSWTSNHYPKSSLNRREFGLQGMPPAYSLGSHGMATKQQPHSTGSYAAMGGASPWPIWGDVPFRLLTSF